MERKVLNEYICMDWIDRNHYIHPYTLISQKNRTKQNIREAMTTIIIVIGIIVAVMIFNINFLIAFIFGVIAMILFDKKTYTKKRLIIYGAIILVIGIAG